MPATLLQSCLTLWDPIDCSPPGSSAHRILQARTLEWVAMPSSQAWVRTESSCFSFEMVEKDMCFSPPERAPKLQLGVERPLTGGCWSSPKTGTSCSKTKKKLQRDRKIKTWESQIPYRPGADTTNWRRIIPKTFSHWCEGSETHIRLPGLEIWHRDWNSQGICH